MAIATDFVWHGTFTALIGLYLDLLCLWLFGVHLAPFWLGVVTTVNWVLGAAPDIAGGLELYAFNTWTIYSSFHRPDGKLYKIAKWIPHCWSHFVVDRVFHTEANQGKWWGDKKLLWAVLWGVNIGLLVLYLCIAP